MSTAYRSPQRLRFVRRKVLSLGATLGLIGYLAIVVFLMIITPQLIDRVGVPAAFGWLFEVLRWLIVVVLMTVCLRLVYRFAPDRRTGSKPGLFSPGAIVATLIWALASAAFAVNVEVFGSHSQTYGALAGGVVLLLWIWLAAAAVLFGAEINSEFEPVAGEAA